jgi:hypothetical protein
MMMDDPAGRRSDGLSRWPCRVPLLAAALAIGLITGLNLARLVRTPAPRNPWEATEVLEAWRSLRGMPVYELAPDGHAAHFYGALVPWVQGEIFRWVGPNNSSGRVLTLVSALATVTLLAWSLRGDRSPWYLPVAWAALLGVNHRSCQYFAENRPDMTALMFAALSLLLIGSGQEARRGRLVALGSAALMVGFFFKQTVFVFAAVPPIVLLLRGRWPDRSELRLALIPPAVAVAVLLGLRVFSPTVYHYMIEVPGAYHRDWAGAVKYAWELLADSSLFLVLLGEWILLDGSALRRDPRVLWLLAVLAVAVPVSVVSYAKVGGAPNSLLPALLAMMAFCILRLPRILGRLEGSALPRHVRWMFGTLLALTLLMTTFPRPGVLATASPWDGAYAQAIAAAARLPGTVICPEDPTIPLYAKQYAGRGLFAERDARPVDGTWPRALTPPIVAEFRAADYVVDVQDYWDDLVDAPLLRELGFAPMDGDALDPSPYRIWCRAATGAATTAPRTALSLPDPGPGHRPSQR